MVEALRHWEQTSYLLKRQCIVLHNMSENEKVKKIYYSYMPKFRWKLRMIHCSKKYVWPIFK